MARRSDVSDKETRPAGARKAPLDMGPEEFRRAGHRLVDLIAESGGKWIFIGMESLDRRLPMDDLLKP